MNVLRGLGAVKEAAENSKRQLKIKSGESKILRILSSADDIISVYEHTDQIGGQWKTLTCLGPNTCPLCKAGKKASLKSYLVVLDREDSRVKIFKCSKTVGVQLIGLAEEYGDLTTRDFKVHRTGDKLDTTYQFFPRDVKKENLAEYEIPDIMSIVRPLEVEDMEKLLAGAALESISDGEDIKRDDYPF